VDGSGTAEEVEVTPKTVRARQMGQLPDRTP
jgi:hypothetical protein